MSFKNLINSCEAAAPYHMPSRKEIEEISKKDVASPVISRPIPPMPSGRSRPKRRA